MNVDIFYYFKQFGNYISNRLYLLTMLGLFVAGIYLQLTFVIADNPVLGLVLLNISVFSIMMTFQLWRWFSDRHAHRMINFFNNHFIGRKLIAGGSFSYYEYAENPDSLSMMAPVSRFISLLIAFLGLSTSLLKITASFIPEIVIDRPTLNWNSVLIWSAQILIVPLILTPLVPVIWVMEDLKIKAWNKKKGVNWMVADKYRSKFNSFIAVGSITAGLGLTSHANASLFDNLVFYITLLGYGTALLTLPLSILTFSYIFYFRGKVSKKVRNKTEIPIILTELIYDVRKYKSQEDRLKELEKLESKVIKKREPIPGFLGLLGFSRTVQAIEEPSHEDGSVEPEEEEEVVDNKFLSSEKVTSENFSKLEEKYFGETSGRSLSKKKDPSPVEKVVKAPVDLAKKTTSTIGSLFKGRNKKKSDPNSSKEKQSK